MKPQERVILFSSLLAGAAAAVGTYLVAKATMPKPRQSLRTGSSSVATAGNLIPIVTQVIYPHHADAVLSRLEHLSEREPLFLVIHTLGGCAVSSVLIAEAVRRFDDVTAIVPYKALSGGTIIALAASRIELGRNAALSAVDPIIGGVRARHVADDPPGLRATASEYEEAIREHVRESLSIRLGSRASVDRALDVFMGLDAPHEWPIRAAALRSLGLQVAAADDRWADYVDALNADRPTISIQLEDY